MDKLQNAVLADIRKYDMIRMGDSVTVGLSGGADSVCLLHVLFGLKALLGIRLSAVHVNHLIRGEEAERDEAFCRTLCETMGIPFEAVRMDAPAMAKALGVSLEEAARKLRYGALQKAAERFAEGGSFVVATAHHADDQAETILFHLLRGSGLRGLSGIPPVRKEGAFKIIRPLLFRQGTEIRQYAEEKGLSFVTDSTNLETDYTRNRIRHEILPLMERAVNQGAAKHILAAGALCGEADAYFREEAKAYLKTYAKRDIKRGEGGMLYQSLVLNQKELKERAQIIRRYVIMEALRALGTSLKDWSEAHFGAVDRALFMPKGTHLDLPEGVFLENAYRETLLYRRKKDAGRL